MTKQKQNQFNTLIFAIIIIFLAVLALRFFMLEESSFEFSGPNIYRSVYVFQVMDEQGYEVDLVFEGQWVDTGASVSGNGRILSAERGQYVILFENNEVTVGGPTSATEDIAADVLQLQPANKEVVKVGVEPVERADLNTLTRELDALANAFTTPTSTGVLGTILIDVNETLTPTLVQAFENVLPPENQVTLFERGVQFKFENANLRDLEEISTIFETQGIVITKVATSRLELAVRTQAHVAVSRNVLIQRTESLDFDAYFLKVIQQPVQ